MASVYLCIFMLFQLVRIVHSSHHDFRFISRQDLEPTITTFIDSGTTNFFQMLFDISSNEVIVSAKNSIFRLTLQELDLLEKESWKASPKNISQCIAKGQSENSCQNYIQILHKKGNKLLACGTHAFLPQCTWRKTDNISLVTEWMSGVAKCPYSPLSSHTSIILENGDYYYGGPTDFSGSESLLSKTTEVHHTVKTRQYNPLWLNQPQFVGSFETNDFVYFVFREAAVEYMNCGKIIYSRIARVCKNDMGAHNLYGDIWTTFIKARLNCSISGDYPFYFNEVQSISYEAAENLMYAVFTTPNNGIGGSAICAFNLTAINDAFNGPFKYQEGMEAAWHASSTPHREHLECKSSTSRHLIETTKYQLMDSAVQPLTLDPVHIAEKDRYTHITTDIVSTKLHKSVHVLYVVTSDGLVKKIAVLPRTLQACTVEVWETSSNVRTPVRNMRFVKQTNSVYFTTDEKIFRILVDQCKRHISKNSCLNAMDPYCGWNERDETCSLPPDGNPLDKYWEQSVVSCPVLDSPVDGGWSSWGPWNYCLQKGTEDPSDTCLCQQRYCNNPAPANGGKHCTGISLAVTNCTVHGGWSDWSSWSACSATCGQATKIKTRSCTNPAPVFGGRVCVGQSTMEAYCSELLPCPIQPKNGGWSEWEPWNTCSVSCGIGFRKRRRRCNNPRPKDGGQHCVGNDIEYEECIGDQCEEHRKHHVTEWIKDKNTGKGSYIQKRYKFVCRANVGQVSDIRLNFKEEVQICDSRDKCYQSEIIQKQKWSAWSPWNECSVECGSGTQNRTRYCDGRACQGSSIEIRQCTRPPCSGEWSCWSEWSPCNVSCGWGVQTRTRSCLTQNCKGINKEMQPCEQVPCESLLGWENWSAWSLCDENYEQHRKRKCRTTNPAIGVCQGSSFETRICVTRGPNDCGQSELQLQSASIPIGLAIAYLIIGAILGVTCGVICVHIHLRKKKTKIPSSPHYINAKQNPYVTVPLHNRSKKNSASTSNNLLNNVHSGTIKSSKCYDYDTVKRGNHVFANIHHKQDFLSDDKSYYD
ncbi:semaphorin-5B isoform X1 [Coccinella septempunctata]|uniref:semaphorin-5B isoform X1 n=2 Tax=Coccinella septempunctata TaxID=41139 RepID=UPI001D06C8CC|nr:semaphorin-5B isoform X1 [Coccinella septempunctata]